MRLRAAVRRRVSRLDPAALRGAWWALRAVRLARRELRARPVAAVRLPAPPSIPVRGDRGVQAVLGRLEPSCLERALVLQRWLAAHGEPRAVVIGVTTTDPVFCAHAWLDGETAPGFEEIMRVAP
jgi:Transglutaminase-like superfamily